MRTADKWTDYKLIDASGGMRLERWGSYTLCRPDPQVIWKTERKNPLWNSCDAIYHRSEKGGGSWEFKKELPNSWKIKYRDLTFIIRPTGFKHTGLFPEQAVNWDLARRTIESSGRQISVLNLFAYTGGATLACARAGASVCHVDASKAVVQWARENAEASGLSDKPIRWIVDDCLKFVEREIRRGKKYDAIIMDPPSYGRGPSGEVFRLEDSVYELVKTCVELLSERPLLFMLNSYTAGISPSVMSYMLGALIKPKFGGTVTADEIGLPVEEIGYSLPAGSTAVWRGYSHSDQSEVSIRG